MLIQSHMRWIRRRRIENEVVILSGKSIPKPKRRMGSRESEAYQALLDATESVLSEEGYGSLTSRRVCEVAGVKPQLLYYYFTDMDDLLVSAYRRRTERGMHRLKELMNKKHPLEAIWDFVHSGIQPRITFEYMALSNYNDNIKHELGKFMKDARDLEIESLKDASLSTEVVAKSITPAVAVFLIQSCAVMLEREESAGLTAGHEDVREFVRQLITVRG